MCEISKLSLLTNIIFRVQLDDGEGVFIDLLWVILKLTRHFLLSNRHHHLEVGHAPHNQARNGPINNWMSIHRNVNDYGEVALCCRCKINSSTNKTCR